MYIYLFIYLSEILINIVLHFSHCRTDIGKLKLDDFFLQKNINSNIMYIYLFFMLF